MNLLQRRFRLVLLALVATLGAQGTLTAGVITYVETIEDLSNPLFLQELERTRDFGDGTSEVVTDGLLFKPVKNQNDVSDNFGRWTNEPITYSHEFVPLGPVAEFELLRLSIAAWNVAGTPDPDNMIPDIIELLLGLGDPDDPVEVGDDEIFLGHLTPGFPLAETMFEFSTGEEAEIALLLQDNRMEITITPMGPGFFFEPDGDKVSIRSSSFELTYRIPEPATAWLLGAALLFGGLTRRRRGARQARLR